jgi:hypothetical protein
MIRRYLLVVAALGFLTSCEKQEGPIVLPQPGPATFSSVTMGVNYDQQIFYDFESGKPVFNSNHDMWDLAFESDADGRNIYLNGGQGSGQIGQTVCIYNTHDTSFPNITTLPTGLSASSSAGWRYDDASFLPGRTGIGAWWQSSGASKQEVYLLQTSSGIQKFRVVSCDAARYAIEWQPLGGSGLPGQLQLPKDSAYNFIYFSFDKGIVKPEPPKNTWDIVFTRYRDSIYDAQSGHLIPYLVTGVLTNPYHTTAAADSIDDFSAIDLAKADLMTPGTNRDVIGWDWKSYGLNSTGLYTVNRHKNYVVGTQKGQLYKLHFLDFYSSTGVKGTPSFEYERLK